MLSASTKQDLQTRLRRIAGQVEGVSRMVEDDRYCVDILLQVNSIQAALESAAQVVLRSHVETCVTQAFASGKSADRRKKVDELMTVFARTGRIGRTASK